ncbi:MAG: prepilin-type N-terminal cleavage/methylation domain-containing protein [Verrucomicrobiota bacterium]
MFEHNNLTNSTRGFSLVEILATVTVLSIIITLMGSMIGMVTETVTSGAARTNNFAQARTALNTISRDIQSAVFRRDLPIFKDSSAQADFIFYTQNQATTSTGGISNRKLSLVRYGLDFTNGSSYLDRGLQRYSLGLDYQAAVGFGNTASVSFSLNQLNPDVIGPGVIACELQLVQQGGDIVGLDNNGSPIFDFSDSDRLTNCRTIIVNMAVVDETSLRQLGQSGVDTLIGRLIATNGTSSSESYRESWQTLLDSPALLGGLPMENKGGLRLYERRITLPFTL